MSEATLAEFDGVRFRHVDDNHILYMAVHDGDGEYTLASTGRDGYNRRQDGYSHAYIRQSFAECLWIRVDRAVRTSDIRPMVSLASAVAEVFAVPTPEQSRRYVDIAIRSIRNEPFAKAIGYVLMAMPERCTKSGISPHEIMATIDACRAWEHARGKVAPGKRALSHDDVGTLIAVAQVAAWARVRMCDAAGIGAIVGEFYERARATC